MSEAVTKLPVRMRRRAWLALPVAAAAILILIEVGPPAHAAFPQFDMVLFHAIFGSLAAAAVLALARVIELLLIRPGVQADD
jgi:uncharacterized membrane protein YoaK (UPF0700 family)